MWSARNLLHGGACVRVKNFRVRGRAPRGPVQLVGVPGQGVPEDGGSVGHLQHGYFPLRANGMGDNALLAVALVNDIACLVHQLIRFLSQCCHLVVLCLHYIVVCPSKSGQSSALDHQSQVVRLGLVDCARSPAPS